jgi:hypothetical protein
LRAGRSRPLSPTICCSWPFHPQLPLWHPSCCLAMRASRPCTPRPAIAPIACRVDKCAGRSVSWAMFLRKTHPSVPTGS